MSKTLVITEKPSVAREYAKILSVNSGRNDGFIENNNYIITWCIGHLVTMTLPDNYDESLKKWRLETLPFLPKEYRYEVIERVKKQFDIVKKMLNRDDVTEILWAGDPAREGQYIEELVRMVAGVNPNAKEKRVWIDSITDEELKNGIQNAQPMNNYSNLGASGYMRAIEDYAMGMNFSRVLSIQFGRMMNEIGETKQWRPIAVGRVMTCVLGMIVQREREIRNFNETIFFRIYATLIGNDTSFDAEWKANENSSFFQANKLYKDNGFFNRDEATNFINQLQNTKTAIVKSIEKKMEKKNPPLLFNLAELQAECAKRFKIRPDETLEIAQELYEKKLTTYPRTDARVLSSAISKTINKNIEGLTNMQEVADFAKYIIDNQLYNKIQNSKYVDDSKISDHYAIIPTGQGLQALSSLNQKQFNIYILICQRFLSIFYPPADFSKISLCLNINEENFYTSLKTLKNLGYLTVAGFNADEKTENCDDNTSNEEKLKLGQLLSKLKKDDILNVSDFNIKEGKTSPPKRYNSGSMILAMENAGQLIEDAELREQIKGSGIGTSATRAEILKKLQDLEYIGLNNKTQILSPQKLGEMVFEIVQQTIPALLNPTLTASWEKGLTQVSEGITSKEEYLGKLNNFVANKTEHVKQCNNYIFYGIREKLNMVKEVYNNNK